MGRKAQNYLSQTIIIINFATQKSMHFTRKFVPMRGFLSIYVSKQVLKAACDNYSQIP